MGLYGNSLKIGLVIMASLAPEPRRGHAPVKRWPTAPQRPALGISLCGLCDGHLYVHKWELLNLEWGGGGGGI